MNLNKLTLMCLGLLMGFSLRAQIETENFTKVKASGGMNIYLDNADFYGLTVLPDSSLVDQIKYSIKNGVLSLSHSSLPKGSKLVVLAPQFQKIQISGGTDIFTLNQIQGNDLYINSSGASDSKLDLNYTHLNIKNTGASDLVLHGKVDSLKAQLSGASDLDAFDMENIYCDIKASGASDVKVNTDSTIIADISGASSIKYSKEPAHKTIESNGASDNEQARTTWVEANDNEFEVNENEDTVRIRLNDNELIVIDDGENTKVLKRKIDKKKKKKRRHFTGNWSGMEFGMNGYLDANQSLNLPNGYDFMELNYPKSINFNLNFLQQSIPIIGSHFGLVTGLGIQWYNYKFLSENTIITTDSGRFGGYLDNTPGVSYTKSKLTASYVVVPLILEFQTNQNHGSKSFHISAGVEGGLRLTSHTKTVYTVNGTGKSKPKTFDDFYLNPFRLDATARIGWGPINLYANYSLIPMFRNGKGPELYPFTIGFVIPFS